MKNNKKFTLEEYKQPIYVPNSLFVCKNFNKSRLDKLFEYADHSSIYSEEYVNSSLGLTVYGCVNKKTNLYCVVVLLSDDIQKQDILEQVDICAHEAFHVADRILEYSGVELVSGNEETYAFMVGWATRCIYKTLKK
jgi:hypothetical protein